MKYSILFLVLCVLDRYAFGQVSDEGSDVLESCCTQGQKHAMTQASVESCASAALPDDIQEDQKNSCRDTLSACCTQQLQEKEDCIIGIKQAVSKQCNAPKTDIGKECCNECVFGRVTGSTAGAEACGDPNEEFYSSNSALRKHAFYECCMAAVEVETTTEKRTTTTSKAVEKVKCKENSCEHICTDEDGVRCLCREGYRLQSDKRSCKDINECAEAEDDLCTSADTVCHNTEGSFKCVPIKKREVGSGCPPGFKKNVINQVCDDINECQLPRPPCPKYLCQNTIGGFKCSGKPGKPFKEDTGPTTEADAVPEVKNDICPPGFRAGEDDECLDIDECEERVDDCQRLSQHCINTHGSYFCQDHVSKRCAPGFKVNTATGICEDIDECEESMEVCKRIEVCVNLPGAYNCKSKISTLPKLTTKKCQEGTRMRPGGSVCEDIDECREGTHLCDQFQNCINTFGGHECRCKNGFELDSSSGSCVDVDECALKLDNCEGGLNCLNVLGSFTCTRSAVTTSTTPPPEYEYEYYDSEEEKLLSELPETTSSTTTSTTTTTTTTTTTPRSTTTTPRPTTTQSTTSTTEPTTSTTSTTVRSRPRPRPYQPPRRYHYQRTTPRTTSTTEARRPYYPGPITVERPEDLLPEEKPDDELPDDTGTEDRTPENRRPENRRPEDRRPEDRRPEDRRPEDRRPEDRRPEDRRPEDRRPEDRRPEERRPEDRRPDYRPYRPYNGVDRTNPRRPQNYPRRPTTPVEVTVTAPTDINTIERDRNPDGTYYINTGDIPKDNWTVVDGDKPFYPKPVNCLTGFERNERGECVDINECEEGNHICSSLEVCKNRPGGYECECIAGFTREDSGWCVPITTPRTTERTTTPRSTTSTSTTTKIPTTESTSVSPSPEWSYLPRGRRPAACDQGYTYSSTLGRCTDIDECATRRSNCSPQEDCVNTEGGYRCVCGQRCRDNKPTIDSPPEPPVPESNVITVGAQYGRRGPRYMRPSYSRLPDTGAVVFTCPWGYKLNPDRYCLDIDECERNVSECGPQQKCENFFGGYSCQCPAGHRLLSKQCYDIDECAIGNPCSYNAKCINTPGSYRCECGPGFRNAESNPRVCEDVDECSESGVVCEHGCSNVWGGYRCYCSRGYRLRADNRTCEDVDECAEWGARGRVCGGRCVNTPGSFRCACPAGYRLADDNRSCVDIDECESGTAQCGNEPGAVCQNTRGGFHCHQISCPPGYRLDGKHKCSRIQRSCLVSDWNCLQQPSSYSYNFITFVSKIYLPMGSVDLFTMHGPAWPDAMVSFEMRMIDVQASQGVKPADLSCFDMRPTGNVCVVSLLCSLEGPQVAELELAMSLHQRAVFAGSAVARLIVIVSEYEF